jgi:hypothetical protein
VENTLSRQDSTKVDVENALIDLENSLMRALSAGGPEQKRKP